MSQNDQVLPYPLPYETALEAPAEWERLRGQCPVATIELPSGDHAKLLTRHHDVKALLSDPRFARPTAADNAARVAPTGSGGAIANGSSSMTLPDKGEPHQRWRRMVGKWFTAKRMTALRPSMVEIAERLIDDMLRRGAPGDLKAMVGFPLPVYVICDMLGVPAEDRDRFSYWSNALLSLTGYSEEETRKAHTDFVQYMSGHIAAKRAAPADDLLSMLIKESDGEGQGMSDAELLTTGMGLLVAGHETTANMIGKMVAMLLADRTRWERLLADPSLVRTAVEEALRFDTNIGFGLRRYITEDVEVGDEVLPSGTTVLCSMPAANRDAEVFDGAEEMDLGRTPNPHLTFGAGPHSCLGQALARTELQVTLETLLRKLPGLELAVPAEDLQRVEGLLVGGLREVPVRW
ncbi:cytochrome P450 [Streptosporangium sp. NBC_01639]|uniref:cytochrome P450 n=1 Tax=unclassified Streptosporangium TaxID=2632669 RepID=UPI002DD88E66|nr:cytochrome P450 [Streptosporangium sp. NBC_01756]WSC86374.1 cytochrome P450 [Streptosporangium sp. NBC_01756]WTD54597.1 cytochrome P450 [Streptosporangium sp. NBC_01639]